MKKSNNTTDDFIKIDFNDLKIFLPWIRNKKRFYKEIVNFAFYKLKDISFQKSKIGVNKKLKASVGNFFTYIKIDEEYEKICFSLSFLSYYAFSKFGNFMSFNMKEFCSFKNKYTKSLFRLIKQHKNSKFQKNLYK